MLMMILMKAAENICIGISLALFPKDIKYLIYPSEPWVPVNPSYRKELNSNFELGYIRHMMI